MLMTVKPGEEGYEKVLARVKEFQNSPYTTWPHVDHVAIVLQNGPYKITVWDNGQIDTETGEGN